MLYLVFLIALGGIWAVGDTLINGDDPTLALIYAIMFAVLIVGMICIDLYSDDGDYL